MIRTSSLIFILLLCFTLQLHAESFAPSTLTTKNIQITGAIPEVSLADGQDVANITKTKSGNTGTIFINFDNVNDSDTATLNFLTQFTALNQLINIKVYNRSKRRWLNVSKVRAQAATLGSFKETSITLSNFSQWLHNSQLKLKLVFPRRNKLNATSIDLIQLTQPDDPTTPSVSEQTYQELSTAITRNPERGTVQYYTFSGDFAAIWEDVTPKTLIHLQVLLTDFAGTETTPATDISAAYLAEYEKLFNYARENGFKIVLRHAYNASGDGRDVPLAMALRHIEQLSVYWNRHQDVLLSLEAGFAGAWGEWHSSTNNLVPNALSNQEGIDNGSAILTSLFSALPSNRFVQIRNPKLKQNALGRLTPISSDEAFSGSDYARLGHHNDCVVSNETDYGTYANPDSAAYNSTDLEYYKQFISDDTLYSPNGGESCNYDETYTNCTAAVATLKKIHFSFLSHSFFIPEIKEQWQAQGCYDEIVRDLGYRLVIESLKMTSAIAPGADLAFEMALNNKGYAALFNKRPINLLLKSDTHIEEIALDTDPRRWTPGTHTVTLTVPTPASLPVGEYKVYLEMPDEDLQLQNDPRYSIQLSNTDMWDETTGLNDMNLVVTVQ